MTTLPPTLTTEFYKRDLPTLSLPSLTQSYTTPSVTVPPNDDNPYILRTSDLSGTVFIAFGSIVSVILIGFILYHLINSMIASRRAKKAFSNDKQVYEKYNSNITYGLTPSTTLNNFGAFNDNDASTTNISKLPLLTHHHTKSNEFGGSQFGGSQFGDTSTVYQLEPQPTQDLTKMFISPTAEAMGQRRPRSQTFDNLVNGSVSSFSTTSNNKPTVIPNLYMNQEINNSDYGFVNTRKSVPDMPEHLQQLGKSNSQLNVKQNRKLIPSMYLEDLIDE